MPQVLQSIVNGYTSLAKAAQLEQLRRRGREDAKAMGEGAGTDHLSVRLKSLEAQAEEVKSTYSAHYNQRLREYQEEIGRLDEDITQVYTAEEARLRNLKQNALMQLHNTMGPGSQSWSALSQEDEASRQAFDRMKTELGRPPRIHMRHTYLPLMLFLSVIEVPINRLCFELFFESAPVIALMMAFLAGTLLMFLAHSLGLNISRWNHGSRTARIAATIGIGAISAALIFGLGVLRNEFTSLANQAGPSLSDLLTRDDVDLKNMGAAILAQGLGRDAWVLIALNVALFAVGTIASIGRHDPNPDYESLLVRHEKSRAKFNARKNRYDSASQKIHSDYDPKIDQVGRSTAEARERKAKSEAGLNGWLERSGDDEAIISATLDQRRYGYMAGYLEGCSTAAARSAVAALVKSMPSPPDIKVVGLEEHKKERATNA